MVSLTIECGSIRRITEEINPSFLGQMFQVAITTGDQLKKTLRPYLKESPMLFATVLQHVATLLPVQGISITLHEKKPDITISKEESIVSMKR
jgi:hypothetical protein